MRMPGTITHSVATTGFATLLAGVLLLLAGCTHKELCFDHDSHAPTSTVMLSAEYEQEWEYSYENNTDWENYSSFEESFGIPYDSLRPGIPDGLRVLVYTDDSFGITNLNPEGGSVYMSPGEHALLFYNNDTEYIVFDELASYASAKATTRTRTRTSYTGNSLLSSKSSDETTVNPPDMLYGSYMESYTAEKSAVSDTLEITMKPLVFTYLIRYEFSHGLEYVALARGALAGMAAAVWLTSGQTSEDEATVLYDCTLEDFGVQAKVMSFGVPDFPNKHYSTTKASTVFALNLEVRLTNGTYLTFEFDVSDQVATQPQGGVIVVDGIEISDEEGKSGSGGFDVDVSDWGDYQDIDLPL